MLVVCRNLLMVVMVLLLQTNVGPFPLYMQDESSARPEDSCMQVILWRASREYQVSSDGSLFLVRVNSKSEVNKLNSPSWRFMIVE